MVLKSRYFISYDETRGFYLCLRISKLVCLTSCLPLFGFIFCIIWSLLYNFEETTFTHCKVKNYLPSISAAIGNHMTQYIVWCTCITLHAPARFLFISIYYRYFIRISKHKNHYIARIACLLTTIENISLLGLTYMTSSESYEYHKKFFITFMASSELYMLIVCLLMKRTKKSFNDHIDEFSLRMKTRLLVINAISFTMAGYFFIRHNNYCEPGMYTLFALFEYIVVFSNIAFHLTALVDFREEFITIYNLGIDMR